MKKGFKHSKESIDKIKVARKNQIFTEETREKMRLVKTGKKMSKAMKKKMSKIMRGNKIWLGRHHSDKSKNKMREIAIRNGNKPPMLRGKDKPNWKGGIRTEQQKIRDSIEGKFWRKSVLGRDNFTCQKCNQRGGILVAHHILNFAEWVELRFAIDNGCTLCRECHLKFHKKYNKYNNTQEQLNEFLYEKITI